MVKTFEIKNINEIRGCMLVEFKDSIGNKSHTTEIPIPAAMSTTPTDDEIADWVQLFWPHTQLEAPDVTGKLVAAGAINKVIDITSNVPTPEDVMENIKPRPELP